MRRRDFLKGMLATIGSLVAKGKKQDFEPVLGIIKEDTVEEVDLQEEIELPQAPCLSGYTLGLPEWAKIIYDYEPRGVEVGDDWDYGEEVNEFIRAVQSMSAAGNFKVQPDE